MTKSPQAFRTISEVSGSLEIPAHVLRFWESKFSQIKPIKRGGGRRYYRPEDVTLLMGIRELLYDDGMTIKGVQKIFRERGVRHVVERGEALGGAAAPARMDGGTEAGAGANGVAEPKAAPAEPPAEPGAAPSPPDGGGVRDQADGGTDDAAGAGADFRAGDGTGGGTGGGASDEGGAADGRDARDRARVLAVIAKLEALRDRLRADPAPLSEDEPAATTPAAPARRAAPPAR